jgi:protein arginine N-methyltransferase 5
MRTLLHGHVNLMSCRAVSLLHKPRYDSLEFVAPQAAVIHGFAGYFESVLYGDVMISTNPATHSHGMFSWFPIFFPFRTPVHVTAGAKVSVHVWRRVGGNKVWYEWALTEPVATQLHNVGGASYHIGL